MKKLLFLLLISTAAHGQTVTTIAGYPTAVFAPANVQGKLPLVLFFHGNGEAGGGSNNIARLYGNGLPKILKAGFKPPFDAIIVCPQDNWGGVDGRNVERILNEVLTRYSIDTNRIYLTGLSAGGGTISGALNSSRALLNRIAAIAVISPASLISTTTASWFKGTTIGVTALAGTQSADNGYRSNAEQFADMVNAQNGKGYKGIAAGIGHGGSFTSYYDTSYKPNGVSFWSFLASNYKGTGTTPPVLPRTDSVSKASYDSLRNAYNVAVGTLNACNNNAVGLQNKLNQVEAKLQEAIIIIN